MTFQPLISCIMATFGRLGPATHVVEEAIASFHAQNYDHKELIIVNDCPGQTLEYSHKDVLVANVQDRFKTIGEKLNYAIALSQGDFVCRFDDDDISLPWRLQYSLHELERQNLDTWQSVEFWTMFNGGRFELNTRPNVPAPSKALWRRSAVQSVGFFTPMNSGQDVNLEQKLRNAGIIVRREFISHEKAYYLYRWTTESYHLSANPGEAGYEKLGQRPIEPGQYKIKPALRQDYVQILRNKLAKTHETRT